MEILCIKDSSMFGGFGRKVIFNQIEIGHATRNTTNLVFSALQLTMLHISKQKR